jgi:hypothetical protein
MNPARVRMETFIRNYNTLEEGEVGIFNGVNGANGVLARVWRRTAHTVWVRALAPREDKDIDVWMPHAPGALRAARFRCFTQDTSLVGREARLSNYKNMESFSVINGDIIRFPYIYVWGGDMYQEEHIVEPRLPHHSHDQGESVIRIPWVPEPPRPYRPVVNHREVNEHMERHFAEANERLERQLAEPFVPVQPPNA